MAEAAVRRPSGRLTPHAAHSKSDNCCCVSDFSGSSSRFEARFERASISGIPPLLRGAGNLTVFCDIADKVKKSAASNNGIVFITVIFYLYRSLSLCKRVRALPCGRNLRAGTQPFPETAVSLFRNSYFRSPGMPAAAGHGANLRSEKILHSNTHSLSANLPFFSIFTCTNNLKTR